MGFDGQSPQKMGPERCKSLTPVQGVSKYIDSRWEQEILCAGHPIN